MTGAHKRLRRLATLDVAWTVDAECRRAVDAGLIDADAFFPRRGAPTGPAKAVCWRCPVRMPCLEYALEARERFGIWGGTSERERRRILRHRRGVVQEPGEDTCVCRSDWLCVKHADEAEAS